MRTYRWSAAMTIIAAIIGLIAGSLGVAAGGEELSAAAADPAAAVGEAPLQPEVTSAPELLLFQEMPMVVTASRTEERAMEAPASVTVITREQIANSGAISIPDILRMVPGVDVVQNTGANWEVSIRGFVHIVSNKVLVLVDGRTAYNDVYANANWYELPVVLEDIERIEIIRGPLSSLWGANAYLGVINIITRTPAAATGTLVTAAYGTRDSLRAVAAHGGGSTDGRLRYKIAAAREEVGQWPHPLSTTAPAFDARNAGTATKVTGTAEWSDRHGADWTLSAGRSSGGMMMLIDLTRDHRWWEETVSYWSFAYDRQDLCVRTYWNSSRLRYHQDDLPVPAVLYSDLLDVEAVRSQALGAHSLVYGASFRQKQVGQSGVPTLDGPHHQRIWAAYVEDAYQVSDRTKIVLAGRYDHYTVGGSRASGRATVMYALAPAQTLRLSAANAFRAPNFLESYLFMPMFDLFGNPDLDAEGIASYDLEYRAQLSHTTSAQVAAYYSKLNDLIHVQQFTVPDAQIMENMGNAQARGVEFEVRRTLSPTVAGVANYTYQSLDADAVIERDRPDVVGLSPRHKANLGVTLTDPDHGVNGSLLLNYRDKVTVEDRSAGPYVLVNGYIGKRVGHGPEIGISFFNLANRKHQEYPFADFVGRRIMGSVRWEF